MELEKSVKVRYLIRNSHLAQLAISRYAGRITSALWKKLMPS